MGPAPLTVMPAAVVSIAALFFSYLITRRCRGDGRLGLGRHHMALLDRDGLSTHVKQGHPLDAKRAGTAGDGVNVWVGEFSLNPHLRAKNRGPAASTAVAMSVTDGGL